MHKLNIQGIMPLILCIFFIIHSTLSYGMETNNRYSNALTHFVAGFVMSGTGGIILSCASTYFVHIPKPELVIAVGSIASGVFGGTIYAISTCPKKAYDPIL